MKKQIFAILMASLVAGCATLTVTGSVVPIGETRPFVPQDKVYIYYATPENFVNLGTVKVVASQSATENIGVMQLVLPELVKQAGSIGANGVILKTKSIDPATGSEIHIADAIYVTR